MYDTNMYVYDKYEHINIYHINYWKIIKYTYADDVFMMSARFDQGTGPRLDEGMTFRVPCTASWVSIYGDTLW
jgi:hypothetical protein